MTRTSRVARRLGVALFALGFAAGTSAAPATAKTPAKDTGACVEYAGVPNAPKGAIPRDDLQIVKQDPLAQAAANAVASAEAMIPQDPDDDFTATIPVRFHEIVKNNGNGGGNLSDARVAAQIAALNVGYTDTGFQFELASNEETVQPEWFNLIPANGAFPRLIRGSGKEVKMKQALADTDPATLEVYSASLGQFLLGFAYFPSDFEDDARPAPLPRYLDGVVIDFRSVPVVDGDTEGDQRVFPDGTYEEGDTLTHEVGHWLELFHTFQDGCAGVGWDAGDRVGDTPAEASPNFVCPAPGELNTRDTCPADPGLDPINNFMDYSFDSCMTEFTDGQAARMQYAWITYRG